jgi:hypothetical protein
MIECVRFSADLGHNHPFFLADVLVAAEQLILNEGAMTSCSAEPSSPSPLRRISLINRIHQEYAELICGLVA